MRSIFIGLTVASSLALKCWALPQDIKFPVDFAKLAERATESVDVTLDASMLQLASGFLSKDDPDEVQVKKLVSKLKGVYVRSFEFDKEGQYSTSEVDAIRSQLKSPAWSRIVGVKSTKGENSDVFLKKTSDTIMGLVVIAAEPKELTVVYIDGPIRPEELSQLGGHMGIPQIGKSKNDGSNGNKKAKEED
ncbi:MAG: DUF4252 domain-containing protein [Acidobacteriota bacterium]|nr:DUF4252 domain-containing protein [Acidobacteriota bacterium]